MSFSPRLHRGVHSHYESSQDTEDEWQVSSPGYSTSVNSPYSGPDSPDSDRRSSIGPMRTSGSAREKEKQRRSRVTPEQLAHLEQYFAAERSPSATRRKEISENLGMAERQTQIWFQNRRAKAKLQDGMQGSKPPPAPEPDILPVTPRTFEAEFQSLIQGEQPISLIPSADLAIGSWRRIATTSNRHDLVVYYSKRTLCLTWFIQSAGHGFKMDVPFSLIVDTEYKLVSSNAGVVSLTLNQPPTFYVESRSTSGNGLVHRVWKKTADWTEDRQGTKVLRHTLVGSAKHMSEFLRTLHSARAASPIVPNNQHLEHTTSSMKIPSPPLAGFLPVESPPTSRPMAKGFDRVEAAAQHFYDSTGHTSLLNDGYQPSGISRDPYGSIDALHFTSHGEPSLGYLCDSRVPESNHNTTHHPYQRVTPQTPLPHQNQHIQYSNLYTATQAMPTPSYPMGYASAPLHSPFQTDSPKNSDTHNWHYNTSFIQSPDNAGH